MSPPTDPDDGADAVDALPENVETRVARRYAHFHRVLGDLLLDLGEHARTFWLTGDRHRVTDEPVANRYAKAVYVLRDLAPFEAALAELTEVQAEAMQLIGNAEPTQSLLIPKVCRNVTEARILENTGFASRARERSHVLARLGRQRDAARAALETFASYPARLDKQREIQGELAELERGLAVLQASEARKLREHYRYPRWMCHVYYEDPDAFDQLYVGDVGVILQGRHADVRRHDPKRRKHRRTEGVEPLVAIGPYVFYDEGDWRAARERS
jgi:hypothetical protein